jgi:hypothetical protein
MIEHPDEFNALTLDFLSELAEEARVTSASGT